MRSRFPTCLAVTLGALTAWAALAQPLDPHGKARGPGAAAAWWNDLHAIDAQLHAANWSAALKATNGALGEMKARIESGPAAIPLLGMASLLKAVAEAGLGDQEAALWDFGVAATFEPGLKTADLSSYGAAGAALAQRPLRRQRATSGAALELADGSHPDGTIVKPEKISARPPDYPPAVRRACLDGQVVVASVIQEDGKVGPDLEVLRATNPLIQLVALEALREWRFRPATLNGKPVPVFYTLTVTFKVGGCVPNPRP